MTKYKMYKYLDTLFKNKFFGIVLLASLAILLSFWFISKRRVALKNEVNNANLVQNFPQVPVYPGSTLVASNQGATDENFRFEATWVTDDTVPNVSVWYLNQFRNSPDWSVYAPPADIDADDIQLLVVTKDDLIYNFSFIKDPTSGKTQIITQIMSQDQIEEEGEEE